MDGLDRFLNTEQAAEYLSVTVQFLAQMRWDKKGPRYAKIGRLIRYKVSDLDKWVNAHSFTPEVAA